MSAEDPLWGEPLPPTENVLGLSAAERESLCKLPRPLAVEGPKFHSPLAAADRLKVEAPRPDPLVINTVELLQHRRTLDRLLDTARTARQQLQAGQLESMPALAQPPALPQVMDSWPGEEEDKEEACEVWRQRVPEVGRVRAEQLLTESCAVLAAHAGFTTASETSLRLLTDCASGLLAGLAGRLRALLDRELEAAVVGRADTTGWADPLEQCCAELGLGSVLALGDYYRETVVKRQARLARQCRERQEEYRAELPGQQQGRLWPHGPNQDDIPEMHFPSSEEGAGGEMEHATPTLDVGMQMLQSLEASGELDSQDSDSYSGYTTPSPQLLTPRPGGGGSPSSKKRRVESGGKF